MRLVICKYSVGSEHRICIECARLLWTKRAYHKTGGLSTQRAEISGNPHIKSSRGLIRFSSRDTLIKSSRDSQHHSYTLKLVEIVRTSRDTRISYHLVEMCAYTHILDTRTRFMYTRCIHFEIHHA